MVRKYNKHMKSYKDYDGESMVYRAMLQRCYSEKCSSYRFYGARGIRVCDRWRGENGFQNFYNDMGARPIDSYGRPYQLDRIDYTGDYHPENCRWINVDENQRNRRDNIHTYLFGDRMCVSEICRLLHINRTTVTEGIRLRKRTPEDAIAHAIAITYGEHAHVG